jgi:hypothetical protein
MGGFGAGNPLHLHALRSRNGAGGPLTFRHDGGLTEVCLRTHRTEESETSNHEIRMLPQSCINPVRQPRQTAT